MPRLSEEQRNRAIGMLMAGVANNVISQAFACTRQTIPKLMTCYVHTDTVRDRQRSGRPRATTARTDHFIMLTHLRQRFLPATVTARRYKLSVQMIRNRLKGNITY